MPTLIDRSNKLLLALLVVFILGTAALTVLYGWVGVGMGGDSPHKPLLVLFGPVLALFTHMSFLLFVPICIPLVGVIVAAAMNQNFRGASAFAFVVIWLALGWWLYDLF